ncbi:MAG TPA: response regulator [Elusimicrobia bacterium]|nr:response regulator [Elusimicrobiota bacterium]
MTAASFFGGRAVVHVRGPVRRSNRRIMSKVMVVDDEKDVVYLIKVLMEREKLEVIEAFNGLEAYNKLTAKEGEKVRPDAIVLDIMMPEMDGYTFQSKLQEIEDLRDIPIVILTAKGQMKDLFELASNIFAFVEKPFEPKNLVKIVKDAIASKK